MIGPGRPVVAMLALALLVTGHAAEAADEIRTIPTRPGVTQSFLVVRPAARPVASVALFAGGNGALHLGGDRPGLAGNLLVRNRARFAGHRLLVAVVDSPSDRPDGLDGFRATAAHADDVRAVIETLRRDTAVPVWLVGTSMGTVSAANAAARLTAAGGPDGLVLTSTVRPGAPRHGR